MFLTFHNHGEGTTLHQQLVFATLNDDADSSRALHRERTLTGHILGYSLFVSGLGNSSRHIGGILITGHSFLEISLLGYTEGQLTQKCQHQY